MYVCVGKGSCSRGMNRRSPEYTDILPVSPTKLYKPNFMDSSTCNQNGVNGSLEGDPSSVSQKKGYSKPLMRINSLNLDINSNVDQQEEGVTKSSTLPRRHTTKSPPPKPPRVIPPKPPRLMEKKRFTCENPHCKKEEELLGIVEVTFKSCTSCFTHYCSPECRKLHWPEHKLDCQYGTIDGHMNDIIALCLKSQDMHFYLSEINRKGYMSKGRGALMMIFLSPTAAELFVKTGKEFFYSPRNAPSYSSMMEIRNAGVFSKYQKKLLEVVAGYSPIHEFVINIAIVVGRNIQTTPVPRNKTPAVIKQISVPLHPDFNSKTLSPQSSQDYGICVSPRKLDDASLGQNVRRKSL